MRRTSLQRYQQDRSGFQCGALYITEVQLHTGHSYSNSFCAQLLVSRHGPIFLTYASSSSRLAVWFFSRGYHSVASLHWFISRARYASWPTNFAFCCDRDNVPHNTQVTQSSTVTVVTKTSQVSTLNSRFTCIRPPSLVTTCRLYVIASNAVVLEKRARTPNLTL